MEGEWYTDEAAMPMRFMFKDSSTDIQKRQEEQGREDDERKKE